MSYTVGEISKLLNVAPSTLRYYDKEGLLPFVKRSSGGIRVFEEKDYEWLQVIECLKHAGLSLKDIRSYIKLAMEGDSTIEQRLKIFLKQRAIVKKQMEKLQKTLDVLEFKCWYYETAKAANTTSVPRNMPIEEIPRQHWEAYQSLHHMPKDD